MKKAGSPTGARGFTLIEVLFALLILSSGIIFIAPALFKSGGILAHVACGYEADLLADNLIAEQEENLRKFGQINQTLSRGDAQSQGVLYTYELETVPQDVRGRLYLLMVRVRWKDLKQNQLSRAAYILK